ncbi:MAG: dihydropteroate synthase, partial [Candidatus Omnitrophota bacterium]|nr:dihydropteroate synthase [Candidatus Omnitrophota bacterium]
RALESKDEAFIRREAALQKAAGASMLDVNCAFNTKDEAKDMEWLVDIVQKETGLPLSIDSPDPGTVEAGLRCHKGKALVNSITLEKGRQDAILPLVKKYKAGIIVLTIDENGMPETAGERLEMAKRALDIVKTHGISSEDLYVDPLVRPISSEPGQALEVINAVKLIKSTSSGEIKLSCGLSNVSFGLPDRSMLNAVFLAMMLAAGLDAAILDPLNKKIDAILKTSSALLGDDEFCMEYIKSFRAGKLSL